MSRVETADLRVTDLGELAEELGSVLGRMYTFLRRSIFPKEMSIAQALCLAVLRDRGPQRVSDLAEIEGVRQPTCTGLVNAMETEGWVVRRVDGTDRRAVIVEITDSGREILDSINDARARLLQGYLSKLSHADRQALAAAIPGLHRLIDGGADKGLV
jgi:DNA-binding MarR family transcriptional regulator